MATAQEILKVAAGEIGYSRWSDPQQGTKYGRWYAKKTGSSYFGTNGVPFCAMGVSWVFAQCGQSLPGLPTASCPTLYQANKKSGLAVNKYNAKPGDVILFDWDGNGNPDHVGLVELNKGSYVQTIEFNTSSGSSGSQSNGGGVYRRTRNFGNVLMVIRPKYSSSSGSSTSGVSDLEKIEEDGIWGKATTRLAQALENIAVSGKVYNQPSANKDCFEEGQCSCFDFKSNPKDGGSLLIRRIQNDLGWAWDDCDGYFGPDTTKKFIQKWNPNSATTDKLFYPSGAVKAFQKHLNSLVDDGDSTSGSSSSTEKPDADDDKDDVEYLNGIDISGWQEGINLSKVPCDFVICKATQGTSYVSSDMTRQIEQAIEEGKLFGTYHYISGGDATGEADYYIKKVKKWIGKGILCLDWESNQNSAWGNESYLKKVAKRVIDKTGVRPLIYVQQSRLSAVKPIAKELNCGLWVAQYASMSSTGYQSKPWNEGSYTCAIRQYTSSGKLSGWSGALDLNKFYGGKTAWKKYAAVNDKVEEEEESKPSSSYWQIDEDGIFGEDTCALAQAVENITVSGKVYNQPKVNEKYFDSDQCWCFDFKANPKDGGSLLVRRIQNDCGIPWGDCDGYWGPDTNKRFIKKWVTNPADTSVLPYPSTAVKNYQKHLNKIAKQKNIKRISY